MPPDPQTFQPGRRLLFVSGALQGHLNPMLPLALAAQAEGCSVVFATGPEWSGWLRGHGLEAWSVGSSHEAAGGNRQASWLAYFARTAHARIDELLALAQAWRPDIVVHEETELAGPVVAARVGARAVVHGLGIMPPQRLWPHFAEAVNALGAAQGVTHAAQALQDAPYLQLCPPSMRTTTEAPVWRHAWPLRPLGVPLRPDERLPATIDRLPHLRTIYLTLGTVFNDRTELLQEVIAGLQALPLNLVVTVGGDGDPARLGTQPSHVLIERYVPNALLLPRCDLVVSHGGSGTLFGTLGQGLPTLLLPQGADQFGNAAAAQAAGAALVLESGATTAAAVAAAARRLLDEPGFARAARRLQAEIGALPGPAKVLARL